MRGADEGGGVMQKELRPPAEIAERSWRRLERLDGRIIALLERAALPLLRLSLGLVFVWFGALKIAGETPVADLVADTVYWVDPSWFVPLLGIFEVVVGIGLLVGRLLRIVLALFALQMMGTFLVLVIQPGVAFQDGNLLLLTTEGEFVVKNLVLLSAGLVIGSRLKALPGWTR
jgi:putative oxidoreductase